MRPKQKVKWEKKNYTKQSIKNAYKNQPHFWIPISTSDRKKNTDTEVKTQFFTKNTFAVSF